LFCPEDWVASLGVEGEMMISQQQSINLEEGWEKEIKPKAIEPLEKILNEGLKDRTRHSLFGPKEYMPIYT